jgi:peroxiredoxin
MSSRASLFSIAITAALVLGASGCASSPQGNSTGESPTAGGGETAKVGQPAPDFTAELVAGEGPKSIKEAAGKVVILDFWATFCDPCKKSFPAYQKIVDDNGGQVVVIGVSVDEPDNATKDQLVDFAKQTGATFPIVWDKAGNIRGKLYDVPKMPTSYIIDKTGVVRHMHAGYEDGEDARVAAEVKELLK